MISTPICIDSVLSKVGIYTLSDPFTSEVRYVGMSKHPEKRLAQHLEPSVLKKETYKNHWVKSLLSRDAEPQMNVVDWVEPENWEEAEKFWISVYLSWGCPLTNATDGGGGVVLMDPAIRKAAGVKGGLKRRGQKATEQRKQRMSATMKAKCADPKERERLRTISNGSPPHFSGADNPAAKLDDRKVTWLRREIRAGVNLQVVADSLGVSKATLWAAAVGKTWRHVTEPPVVSTPKIRLSEKDVATIRLLSQQGCSNGALAVRFDVDPSHISRIVRHLNRVSAS